tara:strand:- start:30531 stop:30782 length:252 start_codon:yes stop_codon:yes gene_type:complete
LAAKVNSIGRDIVPVYFFLGLALGFRRSIGYVGLKFCQHNVSGYFRPSKVMVFGSGWKALRKRVSSHKEIHSFLVWNAAPKIK